VVALETKLMQLWEKMMHLSEVHTDNVRKTPFGLQRHEPDYGIMRYCDGSQAIRGTDYDSLRAVVRCIRGFWAYKAIYLVATAVSRECFCERRITIYSIDSIYT
jgi:hypothetical protein